MSWRDLLRRSLRSRLALSIIAGLVAVLTVSFFALHLLIRAEFYDQFDEGITSRMHAVAEYAAAHPGKESAAEFMPRFRTREHQDYFQIWDSAGRTLARSDSSAGRDLPRLAAVVGLSTYHDLLLPDGHSGRAVSEIIDLPAGDTRAALTVVTAGETERLNRIESRIHFLLLFVATATIALMLLITRYSVRAALTPVDTFARSLERVDPDDPQAPLDTGPLPSELRPVATSFAQLLERLLEALAREKRYARNVAHELRNPLAEMRLLTDIGSSSQDAEACRTAIRDIGAAAADMERIVEALLALTRYEAGLETPQPEPVDLGAELRRQVRAVAAAAEQRAITFSLGLPEEVWVHTDSVLVKRLLANLLGNAISHSPRGSTVAVNLSPAGEVTLANPAPHLVPADVTHLGERFFRLDAGERGSHAGLGLPLALAIAKVLGLTVEVALRDDGWFAATIRGFRSLAQTAGGLDSI